MTIFICIIALALSTYNLMSTIFIKSGISHVDDVHRIEQYNAETIGELRKKLLTLQIEHIELKEQIRVLNNLYGCQDINIKNNTFRIAELRKKLEPSHPYNLEPNDFNFESLEANEDLQENSIKGEEENG